MNLDIQHDNHFFYYTNHEDTNSKLISIGKAIKLCVEESGRMCSISRSKRQNMWNFFPGKRQVCSCRPVNNLKQEKY